jgi:ERCC4-related helicase
VFVGQGQASRGKGKKGGASGSGGGGAAAADGGPLAAAGGGGCGMTQAEQEAVLADFRAGAINVLLATSIGEEGLDIPEVGA